MKKLLFLLSLSACVHSNLHSKPYVSLRTTEDYRLYWFHDGPNLVVTVRNPTTEHVRVALCCAVHGGSTWYPLSLNAGEEFSAFMQLSNADIYTDPCWLENI